MNTYVNVALTQKLSKLYTYKNSIEAAIGSIVLVPLKNKVVLGLIIENLSSTNIDARELLSNTGYVISPNIIKWVDKVIEYNLLSIGSVINMLVPNIINDPICSYYKVNNIVKSISSCLSLFGKRGFIKSLDSGEIAESELVFKSDIPLNDKQIQAVNKLRQYTKAITLLKGPTGSGKTNIYMKIAEEILLKGQKVLILLPEIALTKQFGDKAARLFGHEPHIWTNQTHQYAKDSIWQWSISNSSGILLGSRSALWLPYTNLGLIVVDEEHDSSYKQENSPIYHARDMAVLRSKHDKCQCILVSATPSLETWHNVTKNKYNLVEIDGYQPIDATIIPKSKDKYISDQLQYEIAANLDRNEQTMLFLNRKGLASRILCTSCSKYYMCSDCSVSLVLYKTFHCKCPYCAKVMEIGACKACSNKSWSLCGAGIERIEEEIKILFPNATIATLSSGNKHIQHIISNILNNQTNIIITTQVLSKGYTFPNLTLVAIIDGNDGTRSEDPRNQEKIYQMMVQVRGRCGRNNLPSKILIQSTKNSRIIESVLENNYNLWAASQLVIRKGQCLPPFFKLIRIIVASSNKKHAEVNINEIYNELRKSKEYKIYPPAPTPLEKYRSMFRYFLLIRYENHQYPQKQIKSTLNQIKLSSQTKVVIDVDPYSFY